MIWTRTSGACLAVGLAALTMAGPARSQPVPEPAPKPFICAGELYQLRSGRGPTTDTEIFKITSVTAPAPTLAFTLSGVTLNGLAFNPRDRLLYAVNDYLPASEFRLYRVDRTGAWSSAKITRPDGTDVTSIYPDRNSGTFDGEGNMFVADGWDWPFQGLYLIRDAHIMAPKATKIRLVQDDAPPPGYEAVPPSRTGAIGIHVRDLAFSHTESDANTSVLYGTAGYQTQRSDGTVPVAGLYLYRIEVDLTSASPRGRVSRIVTNLPPGTATSRLTYGAAYIDQPGNFLVSTNRNAFYQIDRATGNATELAAASGTAHTNSDGAPCRPPYPIDVVKQAGTPQAVLNGHTFDIPYTLKVGNLGKVATPNVQVSENLRATFNAGNPALSISSAPSVTDGSCTANTAFDGTSVFGLLSGSDTLAAGASCIVTFTVRVAYANAATVPTEAQENSAYASAATVPNAGHTWPGGILTPFDDMMAQDESTDGLDLPTVPNSDTPAPTPVTLQAGQVTFEKTIANGANPAPGGTVEYTITVRNSGPVPVNFPAGSIVDNLPANTTHAGSDAFTCAGSNCTNTVPVTVPANGNVALPFRVTVNAGMAGGTNIVNTIVPPAGNSCASPTACEASTPVVVPASDMSAAINGLPSVVSPGATVSGQIVCTAAADQWSALGATCSASAQDSSGNAVAVNVSNCTRPTPVDLLPAGSSITCDISYTAPGTPGGSDTPQTSVTVTATTGASNDSNPGNNTATSTATIIDAVDDTVPGRPAGAAGETYDVSGNDGFPPGSTFTLGTGSTCANPAMSTAGVATFDVPSDGNSCTVVYQVCAPAPNATRCDTAVLTVTPAPRAVDDTRPREPGNTPTVVPVLGNDPDGGAAAPNSVELANPPAGATLAAGGKTMTVPGQGVWTVNADNTVTFTPDASFTGAPTPIGYSFANNDGIRSNVASITLSVAAAPGAVTPVPTLSQWSLMLLAALLGAAGLRRRVGSR